jgi:hypothetical protein
MMLWSGLLLLSLLRLILVGIATVGLTVEGIGEGGDVRGLASHLQRTIFLNIEIINRIDVLSFIITQI